MKPRINHHGARPQAVEAVLRLQAYVDGCGLETSLLELVKIRASQINGCAFCLDMHTRDARRLGESEQRLYLLDAWREAPLYTERERAALAWTEALTLVADSRVPDAVYDDARRQFSEAELVDLSVAIGVINLWNRLAVGFRAMPRTEGAAAA
jgi:AhpD family alkylhydroperoxidase